LESHKDAGKKETRHYRTLEEVEAGYAAILHEKTKTKGYHKVEVASANIGSDKAKARFDSKKSEESVVPAFAGLDSTAAASTLHPLVQELVTTLYAEATSKLTATVSAKISERGIETPLGVLNQTQVAKGEALIDKMAALHASGELNSNTAEALSSEFYTIIPHRIGRSKADVKSAVMRTPEALEQKRGTRERLPYYLNVSIHLRTNSSN